MKQKQLAILFAVSLLFAMMPSLSFAQTYEGEKDKKGVPNGEGTMYFESSSILKGKTVDYLEKLTGKFKKGYPVEGKSYRYLKNDGRLTMEFSGKFKVKNKGVLNKLSDLNAYGYLTFYNREEHKDYDRYGYHMIRGHYEGDKMPSGEVISTRMGQIITFNNNRAQDYYYVKDKWLPSKIKSDYNPFYLDYYYHRIKEDNNVLFKDLKSANANLIGPLASGLSKYIVLWSGNVVDGMIDGNGYGIAYKDDKIATDKNLFYIKGDFKRGLPFSTYTYKTIDRGECSIFEVKIENNNGLYNYNVKEEKGSYIKEYGLFFEHNGEWKNHVISNVPIIRKLRSEMVVPQKASSFKDGFANINFIYNYNRASYLLQYKIDENGRYKGLTSKSDEVILSYIDSITTIYNKYSKMFNPIDLKTLKKSFKKYGCDIDEFGYIFNRYDHLCQLFLSDLGADTKNKIEEIKSKQEAAYDMHWIYNLILREDNGIAAYDRQSMVQQHEYIEYIKKTLPEYVDYLLNKSLIKQDAAQIAKDLIKKKTEAFNEKLAADARRQRGEASANYEARRLKTSKIASHRCEAPSGKLVTGGFLIFGGYNYHHIKEGTICFEDGVKAYYNISYDSDKKFECYIITSYEFYKNISKTYKSYDEMVADLINSRR